MTTGWLAATMNAVAYTSVDPARAVQLIEMLNNNVEFYNLICKGIEGVHWVWVDESLKVIGFPEGVTPENARYNPNTDWMFGNQFNAYSVARAAGGRSEVLQRITVSRAFTCYQMLALLEATPSLSAPLVVLHLLSTFYDESIPAGERRRLLSRCIPHLHRLSRPAGSVVSVHPPAVPSTAALEFVEMLQSAAADVWYPPLPAPAPQPVRLF
jgi:hypothetical protein